MHNLIETRLLFIVGIYLRCNVFSSVILFGKEVNIEISIKKFPQIENSFIAERKDLINSLIQVNR